MLRTWSLWLARHSLGLAALLAVLFGAAPAMALRSVVFDGTVVIAAYSYGTARAPLPAGTYDFRAIFRYDDALNMTGSTLIVGGAARASYDCAMVSMPCSTPFGLQASICSCTPEDFTSVNVIINNDPGSFDLLGAGHQIYTLSPPDESTAYMAWTVYWKPGQNGGWSYNDGYGSVSRVESYVPEPASWALLIAGFALTGATLRRRRTVTA